MSEELLSNDRRGNLNKGRSIDKIFFMEPTFEPTFVPSQSFFRNTAFFWFRNGP